MHIIYNFVSKITKFNSKKERSIVFAGKLNKSGFNIFIRAIIKILDKFPNWKAYVIGNEREKYKFEHKNLCKKLDIK